MRKFIKYLVIGILLLPVLLIAAGFVFLQLNSVHGSWRYKMTVVVETPEGIKEGSAVREVSNSAGRIKILDLPEAGNPANFKGEAVVVDLGERGYLFAVLGVDPYREFYKAYPNPHGASTAQGISYYNRLPKEDQKVTLTPEGYPQMVIFKDLNDPKSLALAKGWRFDSETQKHVPEDNMEELLGQGVKIKDITIERTRQKVTWKIEKILPWLAKDKIGGRYLGESFVDRINTLNFHGGNFKKGE